MCNFTETLQKAYSLIQYHSSKIPNVNVLTHCDNRARAATHAFPAPQPGKVGQHRECSSCGFSAFQGRCFERERRGRLPGPVERRSTGRKLRDSVSHGCGPISAKDGVATILSLKASSVVRARIDAANGPAWAAPSFNRRPQATIAGPHGPRYGQPVLTPHAPSRKPKAIYRGPERGTNPLSRTIRELRIVVDSARGSSSSTLGRPTVVFRSASRPQVGGLTSDSPSAGHGPLVKAPETVRRPVRVGRFYGVGVARPENRE